MVVRGRGKGKQGIERKGEGKRGVRAVAIK